MSVQYNKANATTAKLNKLENNLAATDYKVVKAMESYMVAHGIATPEELDSAARQKYREEINALRLRPTPLEAGE
jgi:hypothetical protein